MAVIQPELDVIARLGGITEEQREALRARLTKHEQHIRPYNIITLYLVYWKHYITRVMLSTICC